MEGFRAARGALAAGVAMVVVMTLSACGLGIVAGADFAPGIDYGGYSSFVWDEPDDRPVGDPRLENNPFFEQRLHAAVAVELAEHGIREGAQGVSLLVHHHVTVRNRVDVYEADERAGYGAVRGTQTPEVVEFSEGTILIGRPDARRALAGMGPVRHHPGALRPGGHGPRDPGGGRQDVRALPARVAAQGRSPPAPAPAASPTPHAPTAGFPHSLVRAVPTAPRRRLREHQRGVVVVVYATPSESRRGLGR
mgnify:CR=1 FL=1